MRWKKFKEYKINEDVTKDTSIRIKAEKREYILATLQKAKDRKKRR